MKTSELRSGNLVTIDNPQAWPELKDIPMTIYGIETWMSAQEKVTWPQSDGKVKVQSKYETYGQFSEFIAPIPISEEWIIKCGFEKNKDYKHPFAPIYFIEIRYEWICFLHNCTHRRIKYVHQLQNLFHSITGGEELELK